MKFFYTSSCGFTRVLFLFILFFTTISQAQVGIGNTNPNASSMLDITSTEKGFLAPRMTTAQRTAITTPANSLLVYDTDLKSFYYYDLTSTSWVKINSATNQRNNYKLVKSVTDLEPELAAGGGAKYMLTSNTYYEINGLIALAAPIDLNNAYISGLDANEDILFRATGPVFQGATGGGIRNVTLTGGGSAFNITGGTSLLIQNTVVANFASVGTISNVSLYFGNIVQFVGNTTGIIYTNIGKLLLSNQAWFATNNGIFETFTGTFELIEKVSGFSNVDAADVAIDVSSNPSVGDGVLFSTVFSGTTTAPGGYIKRYTTGSYNGYNFTNAWSVNCPGIPRESNNEATSNFYFNGDLTTGFVQTISNGTPVKIQGDGTFNATNLFRFTATGGNRLQYVGNKTRTFQITGSLSVRVTNAVGNFYAFVIAKNGTVITESNAIIYIASDAQIQNIAMNVAVSMNENEYIEVYVARLTGSGNDTLVVFSENLSIK
ncbi:MAG: hypothetical protein Q8O62_09050 [Aequorivita sp.]|nr:hypothetical protein [Aequorivita sp.]